MLDKLAIIVSNKVLHIQPAIAKPNDNHHCMHAMSIRVSKKPQKSSMTAWTWPSLIFYLGFGLFKVHIFWEGITTYFHIKTKVQIFSNFITLQARTEKYFPFIFWNFILIVMFLGLPKFDFGNSVQL